MRLTSILTVMIMLLSPLAWAAEQGGGAQATDPSMVVATVGGEAITAGQIQRFVDNLPPDRRIENRKQLEQKILSELIVTQLLKAYVEKHNVDYSPADLEAVKARLEQVAKQQNMTSEQLMEKAGLTEEELITNARSKHLMEITTSDEKARAFIEKHPSCFNGTKVKASHILIKISPLAPTTEQQAAMEKIQSIRQAIADGKTTFEEAAKADSQCPSSQRGGDLGTFGFRQMVPPFALAAFTSSPGEVVGPVRTKFGFHLIQVAEVIPPEKPEPVEPTPENMNIAKSVLWSLLQNKIFDQALGEVPIVMKADLPVSSGGEQPAQK